MKSLYYLLAMVLFLAVDKPTPTHAGKSDDKAILLINRYFRSFSSWFVELRQEMKDHNENVLNSLAAISQEIKVSRMTMENITMKMNNIDRDSSSSNVPSDFVSEDLREGIRNISTSLIFLEETMDDHLKRGLHQMDIVRTDLSEQIWNSTKYLNETFSRKREMNTKKDCSEWLSSGETRNGIYQINPSGGNDKSFDAYCDMNTDGGGWTVIQRRGDFGLPEDFFFKEWKEYQDGFGDLEKEFWLGNDRIASLTNLRKNILRLDVKDNDGNKAYAKYEDFRIGQEFEKYKLTLGAYSGDIGDSLQYHNGSVFATKDKDSPTKCASSCQGAWWYATCSRSNLNGLNLRGTHTRADQGIEWYTWKGNKNSLMSTEMKIRPM